MQAWHNQQSVCQHRLQDVDQLQEHKIAGRTFLDGENNFARVALQHNSIASRDQYQHHGSPSNLEPSKTGSNPVPPQQASGSAICLTETDRGVSLREPHTLEALVPDQVCTCAACFDNYRFPDCFKIFDGHPERRSWEFGCRVTGCRWTTRDGPASTWPNNLVKPFWHEKSRDHYGKIGEYRCREAGCKFVTKRWTDFKRHASSRHCVKPQNFECPDLSCKYHQIGFTRKDKLKSHCQNVHEGKLQPGKPNQAIKPKVQD